MPFTVVGYTTTSFVDGLGKVHLDFDFASEVEDSELALAEDGAFPGIQTMRMRILLRTSSLPGVTLRAVDTGELISEVMSWPPDPGTIYTLREPVNLAADDGSHTGSMLEINTEITSATFEPEEIPLGGGVFLFPVADRRFGVERLTEDSTISLVLPRRADVRVVLENDDHYEIATVEETLREGLNHIVIPPLAKNGDDVTDRVWFRIDIDGRPHSARMVLAAAR